MVEIPHQQVGAPTTSVRRPPSTVLNWRLIGAVVLNIIVWAAMIKAGLKLLAGA